MLYKSLKDTKFQNHSDMFRILCDPSSGSTELHFTGITRSELRCQTPTKHTTKYLLITTSNFSQAQLCTS